PAVELHHVFARGLRVHSDQEVDLLLARDETLLAGANREPGWQAGDVRREHVLSRHRNSHLEDGAHEDAVGRLTARAIHRRDLNAEVVDNLPFGIVRTCLDRRNLESCHLFWLVLMYDDVQSWGQSRLYRNARLCGSCEPI